MEGVDEMTKRLLMAAFGGAVACVCVAAALGLGGLFLYFLAHENWYSALLLLGGAVFVLGSISFDEFTQEKK